MKPKPGLAVFYATRSGNGSFYRPTGPQ